jgi:TRAP-type C4-dicarboxylate transport system permease small subunit
MWLLFVYILNVVVGESIVIAIGLGLDRTFPYASLPVSLSLFFFVFWLSWVLAVRWTEPKHARSAKLAS